LKYKKVLRSYLKDASDEKLVTDSGMLFQTLRQAMDDSHTWLVRGMFSK